jgi:purine nucleosidase
VAVPIVLDSDGGVDDAAALWWACTSPDVELVAVTAVAGNVAVDQAAANLATVLAAAGRPEVPVAVGPPDPVGPTPPLRRASAIHGHDGLGDSGITPAPFDPVAGGAPYWLTRWTESAVLVATGPLSNLARALDRDPTWPSRVAALVVMGGSARVGGNARAAAEANFAHDPAAAARVMAAPWPGSPLLVGLDVTLRATLAEGEFALLAERRTAAARFLAGPLAFYRGGRAESPCHDLLALIAAVHAGVVTGPVLPVSVDTGGSAAWGASVVDFRPGGTEGDGRWTVGLDVDVDRFRAEVRGLFGA